MVYKYIRKTKQGSWTENDLRMAMFECQNGTKILTASVMYIIPFSTLYRHFKSGRVDKHLGRFRSTFSPEQEQELVSFLKEMDSVFYGLSKSDFKTGLWPLNPFIFGDEDYAPASVTDRPMMNLPVSDSDTYIPSTSLEPVMNFPKSESDTYIPSTSLEPIINSTILKPISYVKTTPKNTKKMYTNCIDDQKVSPSEIRPIPKFDLAKISTRKRKGQRAEVLTSSSIKKLQYERLKNAEVKATKILPKRKVKKTSKQKPNQNEDESESNLMCLICSEKYLKGPEGKPLEDWIMCCICEKWYHEDCTSYLGKSQFICDFCEDVD